ncbi:LysR family transcriptional regulator [Bradyrhizobium sp. NP1]|uniref:LysR family transcriptional regulator n=1 Tax=Bradyrhizobium sp. NP1 TaxID=3049772 RepID=UPI0025A5D988|nr:LysR family transcriptional regulator [Bradyrhizobium sp. NP1]WJR74995.1 LysR family transcriptional regulator [Bradyrhizobium sp. NP1]
MIPPKLTNSDISLLRVFVAVVHSGGFSAARTELNVSQPTISMKVSDLEARLGMRLCERGRGGFKLTAEGQRVYEASLNLFQSLETFRAEIGSVRGRIVGDLHIGIADATITNTGLKLDQAIERFKRKAPDVHIHMHVASALELELGLVEDRLHVVIGPLQRRRPELVYAPVLVEEQALYCGRNHPLFERAPDRIEPSELNNIEFVRRGYLTRWQAPLGVEFRATATTLHMEATTRLVLSGTHIGYLPTHHASFWVKRGELKPILPALLSYDSPFLLATRRSPASSALRRFLGDFRSVQRHPPPS